MKDINQKPELNISAISISFDETYHVYQNKPLYKKRFKKVMSFHEPDVAAVEDDIGAYHINLKGDAIYEKLFFKTFGFYEEKAAVQDETGWYHIDKAGKPIYTARFNWVGNFQENRCAVRDTNGLYFHIKKDGKTVYPQKYNYVGDFKYGIAVVYDEDGYAKHIDKFGKKINELRFEELDIFHKGYAIAKDQDGYFHINKDGRALYSHRFKWVEPFYNGQAFCCKNSEEKVIVNEKGEILREIIIEDSNLIQINLRKNLMEKLVGYWETQIIYSIVKFEILDLINKGINNFSELKRKLKIPETSLKLIIDVLILWDFINENNSTYELRYLGKLLTENHPHKLKYAALMWGSEHYMVMSRLYQALNEYKPQFEAIYGNKIFQYLNKNKDRGEIIYKALAEYSLDYKELLTQYDFPNSKKIMDIGGGSGRLLMELLETYNHIEKGIIYDLPYAIELAKKELKNHPLNHKIEYISGNFFEPMIVKADTIIMSRILHDWNDTKALLLLNNVRNALTKGGKLVIFETIVPEDTTKNIGTTLNFNLLVSVGGKERTLEDIKKLLNKSGFKLINVESRESIISIIIAKLSVRN